MPSLTPDAILRSWEHSKPVLCKASAWLNLLRIAEAGTAGITLYNLRGNRKNPDRRTLRAWAAARLIAIEQTRPSHGPGSTHWIRYRILPRGLRLLQIDAPSA